MRYQGCTRRWGGCKQEGIFSCQPQSCPLISSQEGSWSHQRFPCQLVPNTTSSEQSPPGGAGDTAMPGRAHISTDARATGEHEAATCCRTPCARSSRPWDLPPVHGAPAQRCLHRARPDKRQRQHSGSLGTPPPRRTRGSGAEPRAAAGSVCLGRIPLVCLLELPAPTSRCSPSCPLHATTAAPAAWQAPGAARLTSSCSTAAAPHEGRGGTGRGCGRGAGGCSRATGRERGKESGCSSVTPCVHSPQGLSRGRKPEAG